MWVLILEALLALGLFLFIIWWTMFSGRRKGERADAVDEVAQLPASPPSPSHPSPAQPASVAEQPHRES